MEKLLNHRISKILIVFTGLFATLAIIGLLKLWTLLTLLLFWFVITPALAVYLPRIIAQGKDHYLESFIGLAIFYAFMVFMIYKLYHTDYFQVMAISGLINLIGFAVVMRQKNQRVQPE